ncbi:MAG: cutinase family protein [Egibacteraceae bacterium]
MHGVDQGPEDMGEEAADTLKKFQRRAEAAHVRVTESSLNYPRVGIIDLFKEALQEFPSVATGAEALGARIESQKEKCPDQRAVLVGNSLGAWVVGEFLKEAPGDLVSRVEAVALYGDPQFDPAASGIARGSRDGFGVARLPNLFARKTDLPQGLSGRVASYCLSVGAFPFKAHDPVCNFTASNEIDLAVCIAKLQDSCPHLQYVTRT